MREIKNKEDGVRVHPLQNIRRKADLSASLVSRMVQLNGDGE